MRPVIAKAWVHRVNPGMNTIYSSPCHLHFANYPGSRCTCEVVEDAKSSRLRSEPVISSHTDEHVLLFITVRGR